MVSLRDAEVIVYRGQWPRQLREWAMDPDLGVPYEDVMARGARVHAELERQLRTHRYHHHAGHAARFDATQPHAADARGAVHALTGGDAVLSTRCERADWSGLGPMSSTSADLTCPACLAIMTGAASRAGTSDPLLP
jgi:hypothetical protein